MLLRRKKNLSGKPQEYKEPLFPTFTVHSTDGIKLSIAETGIGKVYTAKVKLMGINKRSQVEKTEIDWSFEVQSLE